MSWPLASHFSAMLQNPRLAFRDPQLQRSIVEKDGQNQPRPWAGAFAVVYKAVDPQRNEPSAVRVFTSESPERRERYDLISAYLKARRLRCLVDFEYRDRSIRSAGDGKWYPLIVMEWVQGETLFKWARARCLEGNAAALAKVAERWVEAVKEMAEASVAHGDLQHANVMITEAGEIKLVDYDCMCVPALVGRRNLEVGVEPYQHPNRNETTLLSLDLDNFSALMIYVGLRALAVDPQLWLKYVEQPGYDKLLFRKEDVRAPDSSPLFHDLTHSPDSEIRELTGHLLSMARARIDQVPPLSQLANSYAKVEELLRRQQWDEAVQLLNRRGSFRDAPEHLQRMIRQAYEIVCRQHAWAAFQKMPWETSEPADRNLVNAWNESLFAGFEPAERERVRVAEARRRVTLVDRLRYLVQQSSSAISLAGEKSIVEAGAHLPEGYRHGLLPRVEQARRRITALGRLDRAVRGASVEAVLVAAWRAVVESKCEVLVDAAWRPRIELAQKRAPLLNALTEISAELPADQRDAKVLAVWHEDLLRDCREADPWREAHSLALARKGALAQLQRAVETRNEVAVVAAVQDPLLLDYPLASSWAGVVRRAQERVGRTEAMVAALRDGQRAAFQELFDARLIRVYADRFAADRAKVCEWTAAGLLNPEQLGLGPAVGRGSLVALDEPEGCYRVRWTWPQPRFADQCLLAVCPNEPGPDDKPEDLAALFRLPIDRQSWEGGGGSRVLSSEPDWAEAYVVVWAVVDLGFQSFHSKPLVLGRLEGRRGWKWKNWSIFSPRRGTASPAKEEEGGNP